jgi:hypothetical protein
MNHRRGIQTVGAVLGKISILPLGTHTTTFAGHSGITDEVVNTERGYNPSNCAGPIHNVAKSATSYSGPLDSASIRQNLETCYTYSLTLCAYMSAGRAAFTRLYCTIGSSSSIKRGLGVGGRAARV